MDELGKHRARRCGRACLVGALLAGVIVAAHAQPSSPGRESSKDQAETKPEAQPQDKPAVRPDSKAPPARPVRKDIDKELEAQIAAQEEFDRLQSVAMRALEAKDYPAAEAALKEQLKLQPESFVVLYNLGCARSLQGDSGGGLQYLQRAIDAGFVSRHEMESDPMLATVRAHPGFRRMVERWDAVLEAHRTRSLDRARRSFPEARQEAVDERLKLNYLNAFHEYSFERAREELATLAKWADESVFPGILDEEALRDDSWVVVVLPSQKDFRRWAVASFGPEILQGFSTVGGAYNHDSRRLIAQDLGPTLRHEFFHVLHWRSMTRLNQRHPTWVQEGVCSLVEDYDVVDGKLSPSTSWRTNTVKRMKGAGLILPIRQLASRTSEQYQGQRRMGLYAQSRAVFLFLWQKGKLKDWYERYKREFAEDPTGVQSLERAVGMKAEAFDKEFREWVEGLELVPEEMRDGMATLGVEVDTGTGEGPIVLSMQRRPKETLKPGATPEFELKKPGKKGGGGVGVGKDREEKGEPTGGSPDGARQGNAAPDRLEIGDVILAIDGQPVRDLPELLRRMGSLKPSEVVPVQVRRGKGVREVAVRLGMYKAARN